MSNDNDFTIWQETEPKSRERAHVVRRDMVKIHIFTSVSDAMKARYHADAIGANCDFTDEAHIAILAVCGTFLQLACVQSFIDGLSAR